MDPTLLLGLMATLAAPDAHDLKRERGDVVAVVGAIVAPKPLAAPGSGRRWVRRGDDAVLVETRTGRVISLVTGHFRRVYVSVP